MGNNFIKKNRKFTYNYYFFPEYTQYLVLRKLTASIKSNHCSNTFS